MSVLNIHISHSQSVNVSLINDVIQLHNTTNNINDK